MNPLLWDNFYFCNQQNGLLHTFKAKKFVKTIFLEHGIEDPSEAEWLIALSLNIKRGNLAIVNGVSSEMWQNIKANALKRLQHIPLSKIFESADFYGFSLSVSKDVLSPRMETEELVSKALQYIPNYLPCPRVLDLCTGSGAIAIAIAKLAPQATVTATDISLLALENAKCNAKALNANITFFQGDLFSALPKGQKYHIIVSNPPYISTAELKTLSPEVLWCDPIIALHGGESGLEFYESIAQNVCLFLESNGVLLMEIGHNQEKSVKQIFEKVFKNVTTHKDCFGNMRIVICNTQKEIL